MINIKLRALALIGVAIVLSDVGTALSMNLLNPFDTLIRPEYDGKRPFQASFFGEIGFGDSGFDDCGHKVNVLQVFSADQNALKMLEGFDPDTPIGRKRIEIDANDDGVRGHFCVNGELDLDFAGAFLFRWMFLDNFTLNISFPFYAMQLKNVVWKDQTKDITDEDRRVKELLTDDFFANARNLGCLDLCGWKRTGPGDLRLIMEWFHDFKQPKPLLKKVRLKWRFGLTLPTGFRRDEDKIFALPFGFDGAVGLPFGIGLDLTFAFYTRVGFDVQLTHIFNNTRERRIKTAGGQTDLLFLQKCDVHKDFGLIQRFNLYVQLYKPFGGWSFKLGYQFFKRGEDDVAISGNTFSQAIANTAPVLENTTLHQIIVTTDYDVGVHLDEDARVKPYIELFARLPFNGMRAAATSNVGLGVALDF